MILTSRNESDIRCFEAMFLTHNSFNLLQVSTLIEVFNKLSVVLPGLSGVYSGHLVRGVADVSTSGKRDQTEAYVGYGKSAGCGHLGRAENPRNGTR